ncbi:Flp pilus assembly protein TadG [Salirhabdus euzebyi]|uniref:Flp pilus assembly protein TadG n=1 Tax=Salirhabdus euzebyi TaxID=394506 RepID=A0A841PXA7_9BACI|nr:hypothetical protein [Salirhabdus euzebyi]MBB6452634.1 Flp pilus assembly protein TadG [Salirhabdus euzebyi]
MKSARFHPFLIVALFSSAISMGLWAFRHFRENQIGYAIVFSLLFLFFLSLLCFGIISNRKLKQK